MYPDELYRIIGGTGSVWVGIAIGYALFNYAFDTAMCWLFGGLEQVHFSAPMSRRPLALAREFGRSLPALAAQFRGGARLRLEEFHSDRLSWLWPLTVLAVPTAFYGIIRSSVASVSTSLEAIGIGLMTYGPAANLGRSLQLVCWLAAIGFSASTFWRYRSLPERRWFARPSALHVSRVLLFNIPVTYMMLSVVVTWLHFATAALRMLSDDSLQYHILDPDQMYGLRMMSDFMVWTSVILIVASFLPRVMLIREGEGPHRKMYVWLAYGSVLASLVVSFGLLFALGDRLEKTREEAIGSILATSEVETVPLAGATRSEDVAVSLLYYMTVSRLPDSVEFPRWFDYLVIARIAVSFVVFFRSSEQPTDGDSARPSTFDLLGKFI